MKHTIIPRLAFNSGEIDEEVSLRMDVDAVQRACLTLENWEISDMGGIRRRRGFRKFAEGVKNSVLIPFIYTYAEAANQRFLIEIRAQAVNVWGLDGVRVAHFESDGTVEKSFNFDPQGIRYKQINKLLILTSLTQKPWVIKRDDAGKWEMEPYEFRNAPWRHTGNKEHALNLSKSSTGYSVTFPAGVSAEEKALHSLDLLRLSYWTEQQETRASASTLCANVTTVTSLPTSAAVGAKFAVRAEEIITYWVCKKEFKRETMYCAGLDDPGNYPENFIKAENTSDYGSVSIVTNVSDLGETVARDTKFGMKTGYWEYFTCVKAFTKGTRTGSMGDFPSYFARGLAVGDALPCKGAWSFFCSGLWFGSYEVRRNYVSKEIADRNWEARGISFSQCASPTNTQLTGDESGEECFLRLFLTRSRYMGSAIKAGFPPDGCDNKLIVESYKHNEILECHVVDGKPYWENKTPIPSENITEIDITDWSWCSFSPRYGFPLLCEVYGQRLIFASTPTQPLTLWCSVVDDMTNFEYGTNADAAMELTISDTSQNPICWIQSQANRILLGTSEAEWIIQEGQTGFSSTSAKINDHGHIGSNGIANISTSDKVLYVERGGGRVYEFGYSYESDGYISTDITQLAPHIARDHGAFVSCTYSKKPYSVAIFVLADGQAALCTYNRSQQVKAWGRWTTEGKILHACAMPNGNKNDLIFFLVERAEGTQIEVYDSTNEYNDSGHDYESRMLTNALYSPLEMPSYKASAGAFALKLGEDVQLTNEKGERDAEAVQVSGDGEKWVSIDRGNAKLKKGWDTWVRPATIQWEPRVGIKVKGNRGFFLYCITAQ